MKAGVGGWDLQRHTSKSGKGLGINKLQATTEEGPVQGMGVWLGSTSNWVKVQGLVTHKETKSSELGQVLTH